MSLSTITHAVAAFIVGVLVWFFQAARLGAELADERLQAAQYREQVTTERAAANARVAQAGQQVATAYRSLAESLGVQPEDVERGTQSVSMCYNLAHEKDELLLSRADA